MMLRALDESKPDVGSSNKKILGLVINSMPIDVLLLSPPDILGMNSPPAY